MLTSPEWQFSSLLRLFERYAARYGAMFRVRLLGPRERWDRTAWPLVSRDVVVVSTPAQIRDVFAHSHHELRTGEAHGFLEWYLGSDSVLTLDGEAHIHERRVLHSLVRPDTLDSVDSLIRRAARRSLAAWPTGRVVVLGRMIEDVGLDAGLSLVFGLRTDAELTRLRRLVRSGATAQGLSLPLMVLPALRRDLGRWSPGGRLRRARVRYREFVAAEIERRRVGGPTANADDLLGRLVTSHGGVTDPAERQRLLQRLDALSGALENVCPALAWCCLHLGRNPDVLERARAAVLEGHADDDGGEYLEAVCLESLRLNPPFVGAMRRVAAPVRIDGVSLRAGTYVLPCQYLTHRRPDLYPDPRRFVPERFLGPRFPPHEYAPFGGGVRRCLGEGLALRQMRVILAELFRAFEFRPASAWSDADRRRHSLIIPRDPLLAILSRGASRARAR